MWRWAIAAAAAAVAAGAPGAGAAPADAAQPTRLWYRLSLDLTGHSVRTARNPDTSVAGREARARWTLRPAAAVILFRTCSAPGGRDAQGAIVWLSDPAPLCDQRRARGGRRPGRTDLRFRARVTGALASAEEVRSLEGQLVAGVRCPKSGLRTATTASAPVEGVAAARSLLNGADVALRAPSVPAFFSFDPFGCVNPATGKDLLAPQPSGPPTPATLIPPSEFTGRGGVVGQPGPVRTRANLRRAFGRDFSLSGRQTWTRSLLDGGVTPVEARTTVDYVLRFEICKPKGRRPVNCG